RHRLTRKGGQVGGLLHPGAGVGARIPERRQQHAPRGALHLHAGPVVRDGVGTHHLDPERELRAAAERHLLADAAVGRGAGAADVTCTHWPVFVQVFGKSVAVVPAVLSFSVAEAHAYLTVSLQTPWYQNESVPPPEGTVNVCATELTPADVALPTCTECMPP